MNPADILIILFVAVIFFLALRKVIKNRGKSGCSCGCSNCSQNCSSAGKK